jgi:pantoate--beta-alanine ligase
MGALHEGHLALIRRAVEEGRPVVVSIFVNPTQFTAGEDFGRYPRCLEADVAAAEAAGADFVFAPSPDAVYPPDEEVPVPPLPAVATEPGLEDAYRPGHFAGVCQVVARLFDLLRPTRAIFGEKDFQQLRVIEAMVASAGPRWPGLRIVALQTQRDADGLALSSRNAYIATEDRQRARGLARALQLAHAAQHPATAEQMMRETLEAHDLEVDYAVVRDAEKLLPVATLEGPTRGLLAARLGDIRLIDNMPMTIWR